MRKALLVGAGGMGKAWARNLEAAGVPISVWVDAEPSKSAAAAAELGLNVGHTDLSLEDALKLPNVDFVVDVTVPEAHPSVTISALQAGLPVIGEKPMAPTLEDGKRMIRAAEDSGKLYMVSQSRRYDPNISALRELVLGQLGGLAFLTADFFRGPHFGGFRDEMASPLLLDMAIHTFDQARFISGADPISVYAEEFNPPWSWYKGDACATASFEMTGGVRFNYRGSWCTNGLDTSWQAEWRACGPNGTAKWNGDTAPTAEVINGSGERTWIESHPPDLAGGIAGSLADFLAALDSGQIPNGECHDNIKSLAMVFAAVESARAGTRVRVSW